MIICSHCEREFKNKKSLARHMAHVNGKYSRKTQCPICGKEVAAIGLYLHMKSHQYQCPECGKTFGQKRLLEIHMKREHTGYSCNLCSHVASTPAELTSHRWTAHHDWMLERLLTRDTPEYRRKLSECKMGEKNPMYGKPGIGVMDPAWWTRERREAQKQNALTEWQDDEYVAAQMRGRALKPNQLEQDYWEMLPEEAQDYLVYTGDYSLWVRGTSRSKNPDFVVPGEKMAVEVFGRYYHKVSEVQPLRQFYREAGWQVLILWEDEIREKPEEVIRWTMEFLDLL